MDRKAYIFMHMVILGVLVLQANLVFPIKMAIAQVGDLYNPTRYSTLDATSHISGTLADVNSNDSRRMTFRSYFSGSDLSEFADENTSNVDFSVNKGAHSNFSAQQTSPDSIYDLLIEENTSEGGLANYELDLEVQWTNAKYAEECEELAIFAKRGDNTHSLEVTGGYMIIGNGVHDWGSIEGTISFWVKMDESVQGRFWGQDDDMETRWAGTSLILDWGATNSMTSAFSFSADTWYFVAIVWDENNDQLFLYVGDEYNAPTLDANSLNGTWTDTTPAPTENRFMNGLGADQPVDGHGDDLRYWNATRSLAEINNDYNVGLTGNETNLRSYFRLNSNFDDSGPDNASGSSAGSHSFSPDVAFEAPPTENIRVDVWYNDSWHTLFPELADAWNNISISTYLDSPTFTIRFKGANETNDDCQDRWHIDSMLLHIWSHEHTAKVEFSGTSNEEDWACLTWTVITSWTTSSVNVTVQLYNHTLGNYSPLNGNGSLNYISGALTGEDQTVHQAITVNPNHFKNATGYWKIKIAGIKTQNSPFDLQVDLIQHESTTLPTHMPWPLEWIIGIFGILASVVLLPVIMKFQRKGKESKSNFSLLELDERGKSISQKVHGKKLLLEVDPTSDYHKVLSSYVSKAINEGKTFSIFTRRNSALHTTFFNQNVEFFLLTPKMSSSKRISKNEVLIPLNDLSILLVTLSKIPQEASHTILFDNLSDTILICGFEKTYKFLRLLLEGLSSQKITAMFIFNPTAHNTAISSSIRGLFHYRITG